MRFHVQVDHGPTGRIFGTVTPEGGPSSPFEGWLELAHLLVDRADEDTEHQQHHDHHDPHEDGTRT